MALATTLGDVWNISTAQERIIRAQKRDESAQYTRSVMLVLLALYNGAVDKAKYLSIEMHDVVCRDQRETLLKGVRNPSVSRKCQQ